jgi:hypothetical protein
VAFSDPQSVTIGSAISLPRTGQGLNEGSFTSADAAVDLVISHQYKTRTRRQFRVDQQKIVTDPLFSTQNKRVSASAYLVVDLPQSGFTPTELKDLVKGLLTNLTASSDANLIKFLGGES